jgi:hypothetical protein
MRYEHRGFSYTCACGKAAHQSRAAAAKAARVVRGKGKCAPGTKYHTYQCPYDGWHLTSQSAEVRTAYRDAGMR